MKASSLLTSALLVIVLLSGCASSSSGPTRPAFAVMEKDSTSINSQSVRVFVEGKDKGITPGTFNVRSGFGERFVTLRKNNKVVRKYEVEQVYTSNAADLVFSYNRDNSENVQTIDVESLNVRKDGTFIIPFFENSEIAIEDRQYGLVLLIRE